MSRRGFTLIELLVVFIVIGILAGMAMLRYIDLRDQAVAAAVTGDLEAVRVGAYNYWADHEAWPPEAAPGITPAGFSQYLPGGFSFSRPKYTLDWENFGSGAGGMQVGVVVTTTDLKLMTILVRRVGIGLPYIAMGSALAFVIVGPDGAS